MTVAAVLAAMLVWLAFTVAANGDENPFDSINDDHRALADRHGLPPYALAVILEAGDEVEIRQRLEALADARQALERDGLSRVERRDRLDAVLEARQVLIDATPRAWAGIWHADQATDLYRHRLATGRGIMLRFGVMSEGDRRALQPTIEHMHEQARLAFESFELMMLAYAAQPDIDSRIELQVERRRVDDRYRHGRTPFLLGAAKRYRAALGESDLHELQQAADWLETAGNALDQPMADRARLYRAEALVAQAAQRLARDDGDADARATVRAAVDLYDELLDVGRLGSLDRFAAAMGAAEAAAFHEGVDSGLARLQSVEDDDHNRRDLFRRLLTADVRYRLLLRASQRVGDDRWHAAHRAHLALLDESFPGHGDETVRPAVMQRLASIAPAGDDALDMLPAEFTLARAESLMRRDEPDHEEAGRLLRRAADRDDLGDAARVTATMRLAEHRAEAGDAIGASRLFYAIARDHSAVPGAERAMEAAVSLAWQAVRDAGDRAGRVDEAHLDDALNLLLDRYTMVANINRWRLLAAHRAIEAGRFDDAEAHYESISRDDDRWLEAQIGRAEVQRRRLAEQTGVSSRSREARALRDLTGQIRGRIERMIERAEGRPTRDARRALLRLMLLEAEGHLEVEDGRAAMRVLDRAEDDEVHQHPSIHADWLRLRIEAMRLVGRESEAVDLLQALAADRADRARPVLETMHAEFRARAEELAIAGRDDDARQFARSHLLPVAELLRDAIEESEDDSRRVRLHHADALRLAGRGEEALKAYDALRDGGESLDVMLGRAEALFSIGGADNLAEAMTIYRRIAASRQEQGDDAYWLAERRMLEVLERVDRNVDRILPRIERLRHRDPELGGEPHRRQFMELRHRLREHRSP